MIDTFNTLCFLYLTKKSLTGDCPITKCYYWTPVIGQLNKPITTRVPGFLTIQLQENSYYEWQQPTSKKLWLKQNAEYFTLTATIL